MRRTQKRLPAPLRERARSIPVVFHERPPAEILADEFPSDILGLFVGDPNGEDGATLPCHILLFLGNLWEFTLQDEALFREEVRITYLHELGHGVGWDEDDLIARGLD